MQETKNGKPILETSTPKLIWKKSPILEDSEKMYNLTLLAIQLNEPEDGVAPTDSRLRPDQRLMEEGKWDDANRFKTALEEKQRFVRRKKEEEAEAAALAEKPVTPYSPLWFERTTDPITGNPVYIFTGKYWKAKEAQEWPDCPDIFDIEGFLPANYPPVSSPSKKKSDNNNSPSDLAIATTTMSLSFD